MAVKLERLKLHSVLVMFFLFVFNSCAQTGPLTTSRTSGER